MCQQLEVQWSKAIVYEGFDRLGKCLNDWKNIQPVGENFDRLRKGQYLAHIFSIGKKSDWSSWKKHADSNLKIGKNVI